MLLEASFRNIVLLLNFNNRFMFYVLRQIFHGFLENVFQADQAISLDCFFFHSVYWPDIFHCHDETASC